MAELALQYWSSHLLWNDGSQFHQEITSVIRLGAAPTVHVVVMVMIIVVWCVCVVLLN